MDMAELRERVFAAKPALRVLIEKNGEQSALEYFLESGPPTGVSAADLPRPSDRLDDRAEELIGVAREEAVRIFGNDVAERAEDTLRRQYFVSTTDHHGPLTHPFFLNGNLVQTSANRARGLPGVIVFACAGISLNNSSFPRGLLFHDAALREERVRLLTLKHRRAPLYGLAPYTKTDLDRARRELMHLSTAATPALTALLDEVYASPEALALPSYTDQIAYTNFLLWKRVPGETDTNLIYLEQERIAALLLERHLEADTIVARMLTNPSYRAAFANYFDGIPGAFSSSRTKRPEGELASVSALPRGTFLFWRIHNGIRVACRADDIPTDPRTLRAALLKKELMPSMALSFIVTSFYHGLVCGGGFSQINYLPLMQKAYAALARDRGHEEEAARAEKVATDVFRGEFVVAWLGASRGTTVTSVPATSVDFLLHGDADASVRLRTAIEHTPLSAAVDAMMPEFYAIITGGRPERSSSASIAHAINIPIFASSPCLVAR